MKNLFKSLIALILLSGFAISCSEETEDPPVVNTDHAYMGNWSGTFDGGDSGTWNMLCDKDGNFTGAFTSTNSGSVYSIDTGYVDDAGKFTAVFYVGATKIDFDGQGMNGDTASGTWGNPSSMIEGTWEGSKQ